MSGNLSRADMWRQRYAFRRYLRGASQEHVAQRFRDVMSNLTILTEKGQISPLPIGPEGEYWFELFTHLLEEFGTRGGVPSNVVKEMTFPNATYPDIPKAVTALSSIIIPPHNSYLVKFSKWKYAEELVNKGQFRLAPASYYSDPSLNHAIRDDELSVKAYYPKHEITLEVFDEKTGKSKGKIRPLTDLERCVRSATDYYVWCAAKSIDLRLFDDFEADSCIIIKDINSFNELIRTRVTEQLPGWCFSCNSVDYFDPYNVSLKRDIDPFFCKHFRYWYQKKYRFVWLPPELKSLSLEPITIELGPLNDLIDYVRL